MTMQNHAERHVVLLSSLCVRARAHYKVMYRICISAWFCMGGGTTMDRSHRRYRELRAAFREG